MKRFWRKTYWLITGFVEKYKRVIFGSVVGSALVIGGYFLVRPHLPTPKDVEYVGVVGRSRLTQIPEEVNKNLGSGLTVIGDNGKPQPGIAKRWEILEDGEKYRFYLDENVQWSNGEPVELEDFNFQIGEVEVEKIEPNIFVFALPEPFAPFPSILSKPLIKDGLLTNGKYTIQDIETDGAYLRQIWLESDSDKKIYRFYDTLSQAVTAFKLGRIDVLSSLFDAPELSEWPNVTAENNIKNDHYVAVFYNTNDSILGGDGGKSIRQALSYAIEDKAGSGKRALTPINPSSWVYNPGVKDYDYNPARANELLDEVPDQIELRVELATIPELLSKAEKIKSDWSEVGVTTDIRVVASQPSQFQAFLGMETIPADPDQYYMWHSTQETNITGLQSPRIDKLLEDGRQTIDMEERRQIYIDFQRFLVEEVPAVFLYHPQSFKIQRS